MSRTRTFIAVELAKPIREKIVDLQEELGRTGVEVKWTEPENLHVTLIFLGEVPDTELHAICRLVSDGVAGTGPFSLSVQAVGCFPHVRRPRVVWVGVGAGTQELVKIHDDLEAPLFDLGYRTEDRKYTPHITLGRVKSAGPTDKLTAAIQKNAGWQGGEQVVSEIHIMGSELTPNGPRYTVLGRAKLA
jgi:2'-5' RNA ligase